jgi:uncharacterized protein
VVIVVESIETIKEKIIPVLKRHNVLKAAIFGSIVRGELKSNSDIDILVDMDNDKSLFDFIQLKLEIEEEVNRRVDLVEYANIYPVIKERIMKEQVPLL